MKFLSRWTYWLVFLLLSVLVVGVTETSGDGMRAVPEPIVSAADGNPAIPKASNASSPFTPSLTLPNPAPAPQTDRSERRRSLDRFATADSFQVLAAAILAQPTRVAIEDLHFYLVRCRFVISGYGGPGSDPVPASVERFIKFCGEEMRQRNNLSYAIDGAYARIRDPQRVMRGPLEATRHALAEGDSERGVEALTTIPAEQLRDWALSHGIQDFTLGLEEQVAYNGHVLALFSTHCASVGCDERYWSAFYCSQIPSTCRGANLQERFPLVFAEIVGDPAKARALWPEMLRRAREFRQSQLNGD